MVFVCQGLESLDSSSRSFFLISGSGNHIYKTDSFSFREIDPLLLGVAILSRTLTPVSGPKL